MPQTIVVAGTASGVGKTSVATGLMAALRAKGLRVQAFKVGPDFLDPMYHELATGAPSYNLDGWMMGREGVLRAHERAMRESGAEIAVVEGMMGLFDGLDGLTEAGSTAEVAKWLRAPIVLVLDCGAAARSVAAVVKGFREFDPGVSVKGLLFNRVGGAAHARWLADALGAAGQGDARVLGGLPLDPSATLPERHLGLHVPLEEPGSTLAVVEALRALVAANVDLHAVLEIAQEGAGDGGRRGGLDQEVASSGKDASDGDGLSVPAPNDSQVLTTPSFQSLHPSSHNDCIASPLPSPPRPLRRAPADVRIAVARDEAFCFYYRENLSLLESAGAELVFFSPLRDALPGGVSGVYIGGGYPELHAPALGRNAALRAGLAAFSAAGGPVYAECGGLILLSRAVRPRADAAESPMAGVFPFKTVLRERATLGYVRVETTAASPVFAPGRSARGQVFHHTEIVEERVIGGALPDEEEEEGGERQFDDAAAPHASEHPHPRNTTPQPRPWTSSFRAWPQTPTQPGPLDEGFTLGRTVASYIHLHFASCPALADDFVGACRAADAATLHAAALSAARAAIARASSRGGPGPSPRPSPLKGGDAIASGLLNRVASRSSLHRASVSSADGGACVDAEDDEAAIVLPRRRSALFASEAPSRQGSSGESRASGQSSPRGAEGPEAAARHARGVAARPAPSCVAASSCTSTPVATPRRASADPGALLAPPRGDPASIGHPKVAFSADSEAARPQLAGKPFLAYSKSSEQLNRVASAHKAALAPQASLLVAPMHRSPSCGQVPTLALADAPPLLAWQANERIVSLGAGGTEILWALGLAPRVVGVSDACDWPRAAASRPRVAHHLRAARGRGVAASAAAGPARSWSVLGGDWGGGRAGPGRRGSGTDSLAGGHAPPHAPGSAAPSSGGPSSPGREQGQPAWAQNPLAALLRGLFGRAGEDGGASSGSLAAMRKDRAHGSRARVSTARSPPSTSTPPVSGPALYVDERVLARERPSLVVAEELGDAAEAVCDALVAVGLQATTRVIMIRRRRLSDILEGVLEVADAAGVRGAGAALAADLRARLRRAAAAACRSPRPFGPAAAVRGAAARQRVLVLRCMKPATVLGPAAPWLGEVIALAGGRPCVDEDDDDAAEPVRIRAGRSSNRHAYVGVFDDDDDSESEDEAQAPSALPAALHSLRSGPWRRAPSPPAVLSPAQLAALAPEVLVVLYGATDPGASREGGLHSALSALCDAAASGAWWQLPAVRAGNVFLVPAALFARAGPRLVDGVELLARALHGPAAGGFAPDPGLPTLKLALRPGQRCRPALLSNYFAPWPGGAGAAGSD
ncbi:hypothetical protein QBZ16_001147 [Prototheca wickerhamii]|uniref:Cobyrinic acid a,c-diamide synthase n=1 Tax=Prototheca wickerhamii TaxID=3111 RepID=A0AAD9MJA1_PROWI|nr:hypothetical protein QBZ16_001147 [Prototheca wickerhamii]